MTKARQFGEVLIDYLYKKHGLSRGERESIASQTAKLETSGILPRQISKHLRTIRHNGNSAVHDFTGAERAALSSLEACYELGRWIHQLTTSKPHRPERYRLPPQPGDPRKERDAALSRAQQRDAELKSAHELIDNALPEISARIDAIADAQSRALALHGRAVADSMSFTENRDRPGVWVEQGDHLRNFVGRKAEIDETRRWLRSNERGFVLFTGEPGRGKSALMSALAEAIGKGEPSDDEAAKPTEPGRPTLLHLSKAGGDQWQILRFLIWQTAVYTVEEPTAADYAGSVQDLRGSLLRRLETVVKEHGSVVVVIDGLDEMINDATQPTPDLEFLPGTLPKGVYFLLSTRPIGGISSYLTRRITNVRIRSLPPLTEADVGDYCLRHLDPPEFTGLLNDVPLSQLLVVTGGVPLLLRRIVEEIEARAASEGAASVDYTQRSETPSGFAGSRGRYAASRRWSTRIATVPTS